MLNLFTLFNILCTCFLMKQKLIMNDKKLIIMKETIYFIKNNLKFSKNKKYEFLLVIITDFNTKVIRRSIRNTQFI